jgi:hypothetical protein
MWRWQLDAIMTHLRLTWHGCSWCGEHHGWGHGAIRLLEEGAINNLIHQLMPTGYYHLRCWNATKWFEVEEVTSG